jgi:phosphatidylserine/phosphatidylglycerophosphate/cardiolipin synthase-like enzyme
MQNAVAFANNDLITIAWTYGRRLAGCMGFAVYRVDQHGKETALPAMARFPKLQSSGSDSTEDFPIQKFYWKDPFVRLLAEKTGQRSYRYKIVPLQGRPGRLVPMSIQHLLSNEVTLGPQAGEGVAAYFNRGLLSTQRIARALKAKRGQKLLERLGDRKDELRASLSGDMVEALTGFVDRAKTSGTLHAALYELTDEELIEKLEGAGKKLSIVLANSLRQEEKPVAVKGTAKKKKTNGAAKPKAQFDQNQPARDRLTSTAKLVVNRLLPGNQIGHNKFVVYAKNGRPQAVLLGSTNWTPTGLAGQTNNALVIEDPRVAQRYREYWNRLAADTEQAGQDPKKLQGSALRSWAAKGKTIPFDSGLTSWLAPNTPKLRGKASAAEKHPGDMADVVRAIDGAQHAVLFLAFYPGSPNVAQWAADAQKRRKDLFVRGCVTNPSTSESFYYQLQGTAPPKRPKGSKVPRKQDSRVTAAQALDTKSAPPGWIKELLTVGFAVVHDKIVVIDPFSDDCVVITGSHNLGHKASFNNDENLVIIRGNRRLAQAYATHVLDVYDHFSWRAKQLKEKGDNWLKEKPEQWQSQYFATNGEIRSAQLRFWLNALI